MAVDAAAMSIVERSAEPEMSWQDLKSLSDAHVRFLNEERRVIRNCVRLHATIDTPWHQLIVLMLMMRVMRCLFFDILKSSKFRPGRWENRSFRLDDHPQVREMGKLAPFVGCVWL
jgi:hypothetical protein